MDTLSPILSQLRLSANVFVTNKLQDRMQYQVPEGYGFLHILFDGELTITFRNRKKTELKFTEPTLIFISQPLQHVARASKNTGAEMVSASIDFGSKIRNPIVSGIPEIFHLPLHKVSGVKKTLDSLFTEAFNEYIGRKLAMDRLVELFLIQLIRHLVDQKLISHNFLKVLTDARLNKAVTAMHNAPEALWTLEGLAQIAGMSRASFSLYFRNNFGVTPLGYLTDWRISVAQSMLRRGIALKFIVLKVGYADTVSFTHAFKRRVGLPPLKWLAEQTDLEIKSHTEE